MDGSKSMFLIRNFGNNTQCGSGPELVAKLAELYSGMSVSIQFKLRSGMKHIEYVDVSNAGAISYTYQKDKPFDMGKLEIIATA